MDNPDVDKSPPEDASQLARNRSFKSKQLVRSQAIRESQSPPRTASPCPSPSVLPEREGCSDDVTAEQMQEGGCSESSEDFRRLPVEIQITAGNWDEASTDQRQRTRRWLGARQHSRDLLSNNPRVQCVCGACAKCVHCRGRRRKNPCPTKQDSGIVCSDECPDCSDSEPTGGSSSEGGQKISSPDVDDQTSYCRCPERKEKPKSISLSRTDSDDKSEPTGQDLVNFIKDTLNKNARDRMTLLKIEKELHALVNDTGRCIVRFPVMTSYGRLLVHRCASLFQLSHHLDQTNKTCVLVSKSGTSGGRIPCTNFKEWCTANFPPSPQRHHADTTNAKSILKRDTHSLDEPGTGPLSAARSKSLEQREREYERVRRRIFSSDNCTQDESNQWQWLNSGSVKLLTPEGRNKLIKVQSLEASNPGSTMPPTPRGAVSKSHSFGGYARAPDPPRLLSRQGDLASSSWRLSPSSSGYRTLSLHSTDSVTPSPTGGASPEPNQSTEGVAVMWAVTDLSCVPPGALVIHPQTGRPLTNADGSLYHFDPANPPVLDTNSYTQEQKIEVNNEKKRGRLEKQHSFMDNDCECQPSEECRNKCCCECRRHDTCHRSNADQVSAQPEQKNHQKPTSPCKNRYEQPAETTTNHNPPPDLATNHRPAYDTTTEDATNQRSVYDNHNYASNHRQVFERSYETNQRQDRTFENQIPSSVDVNQSANHRTAIEVANQRKVNLTSQGMQEMQYAGLQYQHGLQYPHEEVTSPPQVIPPQYLQQDMSGQAIAQVKPVPQDPNIRPMSLGMVYGGTQYYQPVYQPPPEEKPSTFTIDPSYPYAPVEYSAQCSACIQQPSTRPYALYTPIEHKIPHYQYQDPLQCASMQPLVGVGGGAAPKVLVPEMYPLMQYPSHTGYPHYSVMYPQMVPAPYPMYQPLQPTIERNSNTPSHSHRHHKRNSVSGSSRTTPLTTTPEDRRVPYEDHTTPTNTQNPNIHTITSQNHLPNQNIPSQTILSQIVPIQGQMVLNQGQMVPSQGQMVPNQSQMVPIQGQSVPNQNSTVPNQGSNLPQHQSGRDSNDLAAKIKQINDQMSQMSTRERDGNRDRERNYRRDEWKRRNSGNGILGSYPVGGINGRLVGRPTNDDAQLSSAAQAIVNSIRSMQAKNHYDNRRPDYHHQQYRSDRDKPDYRSRREDKERADAARRQPPVYTPSYLLRQMSPGTWCRRSPGPIHPVLNPRRPHPDSRGGRR